MAAGVRPDLEAVEAELNRLDPVGDRVATVLRDTFDQLYDGQRTGRWSFDDLHKTEKTHMGTLVEINLHRAFEFEDGVVTDYRVAGVQVWCWKTPFGWMLPPEVIGHIALVITANDSTSTWRAGLLRVTPDCLRDSKRDVKKQLVAAQRYRVRWLWGSRVAGLVPNLFHQLDDVTRGADLEAKAVRGGQHGRLRVNELFRRVQGRIVRRAELRNSGAAGRFHETCKGQRRCTYGAPRGGNPSARSPGQRPSRRERAGAADSS